MAGYQVNMAEVQAAYARSQGSIANVGRVLKWRPGQRYRIRLGPPYRTDMGMPWLETEVHWGVLAEKGVEPPACLAKLRRELCPVCVWVQQWGGDPQFAELAKKRRGKVRLYAQVLWEAAPQDGWLVLPFGFVVRNKLLALLSQGWDLCSADGGHWLNVDLETKGQWTDVSSMTPDARPGPIDQRWFDRLLNLDPALHVVEAAELSALLHGGGETAQPAGRSMSGPGAFGLPPAASSAGGTQFTAGPSLPVPALPGPVGVPTPGTFGPPNGGVTPAGAFGPPPTSAAVFSATPAAPFSSPPPPQAPTAPSGGTPVWGYTAADHAPAPNAAAPAVPTAATSDQAQAAAAALAQMAGQTGPVADDVLKNVQAVMAKFGLSMPQGPTGGKPSGQ